MFRSIISVAAAALLSTSALAKEVKYNFVKSDSKVTWFGAKEVGGSHYGEIGIKSGHVTMDGKTIKDAKIVIDMGDDQIY